jgi:general secretion pathway protein H
MRTKAHPTPVHDGGFTLLEMLVVIAIVALVAALSIPLLSRMPDGVHLRALSNGLAAALRATRSAAIRLNSETSLVVDVDRRIFQSTVVSPQPIAQDISTKLTFASGISDGRSEGAFHFFPDGSSTGGTVTLSLHGKEEKLCVDWVTGDVRRDRDC